MRNLAHGSLRLGCEDYRRLADVGTQGVVARHVVFQLPSLVQPPDAGEGPVQAVFRYQRPDRIPVAPVFAQGTMRVEVRVALDRGVGGHEGSPVVEAAIVEDLEQLVDGNVAVSEGIGGLWDQVVVPVAVSQFFCEQVLIVITPASEPWRTPERPCGGRENLLRHRPAGGVAPG